MPSLGAGALLSAVALAGCGPRGGTDVGNGATVSFDVGAHKSTASARTGSDEPHATVVHEAWISVGAFRLSPGGGCSGPGGPLVLDGPLDANLVEEDASSGMSEAVPVDAGVYCRLRAELEPLDPGALQQGAPAEALEATIFVRGERADGVPFSLRSTRTSDLRLEAPSDAPFELSGGASLVVSFDLDAAISALGLDLVEESPIVIDETTNQQLLMAFEQSLSERARLFRDGDGDGVLRADEGAPALALAVGRP